MISQVSLDAVHCRKFMFTLNIADRMSTPIAASFVSCGSITWKHYHVAHCHNKRAWTVHTLFWMYSCSSSAFQSLPHSLVKCSALTTFFTISSWENFHLILGIHEQLFFIWWHWIKDTKAHSSSSWEKRSAISEVSDNGIKKFHFNHWPECYLLETSYYHAEFF